MEGSQIDALWREIESIAAPEPIFLASTDHSELAPKPWPVGVPDGPLPTASWVAWGATAGAMLALLLQAPHLAWLAIFPTAGIAIWHVVRDRARLTELSQRKAVLAEAKRHHRAVAEEADCLGPGGFSDLKGRLRRLKEEFDIELPNREQKELERFDAKASQRQLRQHLETSYIADAMISGLGPSRKTTLAQHGITNAAQVSSDRIQTLPGFGPALASALVAWRHSRERSFRYDRSNPLTVQERVRVAAPFNDRRQEIRRELQAGREKLLRLSRLPVGERLEVAQRLAEAATAVKQAELDVNAMRRRPAGAGRVMMSRNRSQETWG